MPFSSSSKIRRCLFVACGPGLACLAGFAIWKTLPQKTAEPRTASHAETYPALDLKDPQPSFDCLRYVYQTGGDETTRQVAIVWIDDETRRKIPLSKERESYLFEIVETNGHPEWDQEYRQWIFNSSFNLLHHAKDQERLTRLLLKLAIHDSDRTMRLYALQHIGSQRDSDVIHGELAEETRTILQKLVAEPNGEVVGTAIELLARWDPESHAPDIQEQAAQIAADTTRPIDVRVTALHASEALGLQLARSLANDTAVHVILRKASIATIGRYGNESDLADLEKLTAENFRLAQAAEPALQTLRQRISNPKAPELIPF